MSRIAVAACNAMRLYWGEKFPTLYQVCLWIVLRMPDYARLDHINFD